MNREVHKTLDRKFRAEVSPLYQSFYAIDCLPEEVERTLVIVTPCSSLHIVEDLPKGEKLVQEV